MKPDILDVHTHLHPSAADLVRFVEDASPGVDLDGRTGVPDRALADMDACGVRTMLVLPWRVASADLAREPAAAVTQEWAHYGAWARGLETRWPKRFRSLIAVDPIAFGPQWTRETIRRGLADGGIGLKIAPELIGCRPDDRRMRVVWEEAAERGLSVTSQCKGSEGALSHPAHFRSVAADFPQCRIVLAHLGMGGGEYEVADLTARHANVYGDTSSWLHRVDGRQGQARADARDVLRAIGIDRIMFGSNYPIRDLATSIRNLERLGLDESEMRAVRYENAMRIHRGIG